jgi:hypothetical protein
MSEIPDEPFSGLISAGIILFPLSLFNTIDELIILLHKRLVSRVNDLIRKVKRVFKR